MKALLLFVLAILASVQPFSVLPYARPYQPNHKYVCPEFPLCYQDLDTGAWKSLPQTSHTNTTAVATITRDADIESSDCWINGYQCQADASKLITWTKVGSAEECQSRCGDEDDCLYFSFHNARGRGYCSLLRECIVRTTCNGEGNCATGRKTCNCPALDYFPGQKESKEYARWTCNDLDPYANSVPAGTKCTTTCSFWKEPLLQSSCLNTGKWSSSAPPSSNSKDRALVYAASYSTPDQPDMECGCQDVGPFKYDPNNENSAHFRCFGWSQESFKKADGWTLKKNDRCELYCSKDLKPLVSVYCDGAVWKGEPELGFWCYDKPENPEPETKVNGGWSNWESWGSCDPNTGMKKRARVCNNPSKRNGGAPCAGSKQESAKCPVNGVWGAWESWGSCTGNPSTRTRSRGCDSPSQLNGGTSCAGDGQETAKCPGDPQCGRPYKTLSDSWRMVEYGVPHPTTHCDQSGAQFKDGWHVFKFDSRYATIPSTPPAVENRQSDGKTCGTSATSWSPSALPTIGQQPRDITIHFAYSSSEILSGYSRTGKIVACQGEDGQNMYMYYLTQVNGCAAGYCAV